MYGLSMLWLAANKEDISRHRMMSAAAPPIKAYMHATYSIYFFCYYYK